MQQQDSNHVLFFLFFFVMNFSRQIQDTIETIFILYIFTMAQNKLEILFCIYLCENEPFKNTHELGLTQHKFCYKTMYNLDFMTMLLLQLC